MTGQLGVQLDLEGIATAIEPLALIKSVGADALEIARQADRIATISKRRLPRKCNQCVSIPAAPTRIVHDEVIDEQGPAGGEIIYQAPADQADRPLVLLQDKHPIALFSGGAQTPQILILGEMHP